MNSHFISNPIGATPREANMSAQQHPRLGPIGRNLGALSVALALTACQEAASPSNDPGEPGRRLELRVSPLELVGITNATYRVEVLNDDDEPVWIRELSSVQFGNGRGDVSYVGPCDADASPNRVELTVLGLETATGPLDPALWQNPAPDGSPLVLTVPCVENADTPVIFNLTIMRAAEQGFFDVAVNFDDIFCSAKFDCAYPDGPIELLFEPDGTRGPTMVMGFACASGNGEPTWLLLNRLRVTCDNGEAYLIDPTRGPGNAGPYPPLFFQTGVYRGDELFQNIDKCYWNIALGVDVAHLATIPGGCLLEVTGTATSAQPIDGQTPADTVYPVISWSVPFSSDGTSILCEPAQNPLNGPGSNVVTDYTGPTGARFGAAMRCGSEGTPEEFGTLPCTGLVPDANAAVKANLTEDTVVIDVGGVVSEPYLLPSTHNGQPVTELGATCCVDPCCAE